MPRQILIKKKGQEEFIDQTNQVESVQRDMKGWTVRFKLSPEQYHYPASSVRVLGETARTEDGQGFKDFEMDMSIPFSENVLKYLVQFCEAQSLMQKPADEEDDTEEETITPFGLIAKKLSMAPMDGSVLAPYLSGGTLGHLDAGGAIFPFGCNASQKQAVDAALSNQLSIIEGPPGTGKTLSILNIIANLLLRGNTIAIVSNNNSAVENIVEKLCKEKMDWLVAKLGRRELRDKFFESGQQPIRTRDEWKSPDPQALKERLFKNGQQVDSIYKKQIRLNEAKLDLEGAIHELEVFKKSHTADLADIEDFRKSLFSQETDPSRLRELKQYLADNYGPVKWYNLLKQLKYWQLHVSDPNCLISAKEIAVFALDYAILQASISLLQTEIADLTNWLKGAKMQVVDDYVADSMAYFKHYLYIQYSGKESKNFTQDEWKFKFDIFQRRYPIITSSTFSLRASTPLGRYDYLIIDEASQVNIPTAALCFSMAKNVVVVGDSRQLTHIVDKNTIGRGGKLPAAYDAVKESILTSCKKLFEDRVPTTMLREHYRCHPLIVNYCNQRFYGGEMIVMSKQNPTFPFEVLVVDDNKVDYTASGSIYNERQVAETAELVKRLESEGVNSWEIGIVAPYRDHANRISRRLHDPLIESDTVHKYQGREKNVIIYNTVVGAPNSFNDDPHLVNVAVSRAKDKFIIVASETMMRAKDSNLASLMGYIRYNDPDCKYITHAKRSSIFDALYSQDGRYGAALRNMHGKESPAEVLFRTTIERVLEGAKGKLSWGYKQEYYLIDLVKHSRKEQVFSDEEWTYMLHGARLDFLVYDSMTREPIMAVEVDGAQHKKADSQNNDRLKNHILNLLQLPLQRFSTASYQGREEQYLRGLLNTIYLDRNK